MLSSLNSQYVCTKDASQGGYTWMSKEEKRYVDRAMQVDNAARNAAKAKGEVVIEKSERSRRIDEVLCKWGYEPERGAGAKERANAILCAQAATQVDVVVPVLAAGMRRWRLELIEPLLAEPSIPKDLEGGADPGSPKETKSEEERGIFWDALDYLRSLQNDRQRQVLTAEIVLNFNHSGVSPFHKVVQDLETFLD
ncbi:hypothetical protein FRB90_007297 [Tulasnella sp. 427]|nr:hypothetical protein FRB90_007297 [Tulasnella sp. 427]